MLFAAAVEVGGNGLVVPPPTAGAIEVGCEGLAVPPLTDGEIEMFDDDCGNAAAQAG
jgi:hypothetical protein